MVDVPSIFSGFLPDGGLGEQLLQIIQKILHYLKSAPLTGRPQERSGSNSQVLHSEECMHAKARLFGHPIHQMLIVFPLGLLATAVIFDVIHLITGNPRWSDIAFWMIAAGIIGGLAAAPFGTLDWLGIPKGSRAKRIGMLHGGGNLLVVILFAGSWLLRRDNPTAPETLALVLSFAGAGIALFTGWLGGELVDRLGVGVGEGAHVNAPSSLSGHPAAESGRVRVTGACRSELCTAEFA